MWHSGLSMFFLQPVLVSTIVSYSTWYVAYLAMSLKSVGMPDHHDESITKHCQNNAPTETEIDLLGQRPPRHINYHSYTSANQIGASMELFEMLRDS